MKNNSCRTQNAKTELLEHLNSIQFIKRIEGKTIEGEILSYIKCADIEYDEVPAVINIKLKCNYNADMMAEFLLKLDIDYQYGHNPSFSGIIWYIDGTWSIKLSHDDYEWWEYITYHEIPEDLK
jgi:hypothetical protein